MHGICCEILFPLGWWRPCVTLWNWTSVLAPVCFCSCAKNQIQKSLNVVGSVIFAPYIWNCIGYQESRIWSHGVILLTLVLLWGHTCCFQTTCALNMLYRMDVKGATNKNICTAILKAANGQLESRIQIYVVILLTLISWGHTCYRRTFDFMCVEHVIQDGHQRC